jgi:hypothetical protein
MMSDAERVRALVQTGYTARQAQFLVLVALHGGHFLRRQYTTFTGRTHGLAVVRFLDTLVRRGDSRMLSHGRHGHVYHLSSRHLYAAIDQEDSRNRRPAEWHAVARKLMTVDFVLAHPDARFWGTEKDKVAYLRECGVDPGSWPHRRYLPRRAGSPATIRYFVDKMPWYRTTGDDRLWIAYVDAESTRHGFRTFLQQYKPLLSSIPSGVTYVGHAWTDAAVQSVFRRVIVSRAAGSDEFKDYCRLRREIEANRLRDLSVKELHAYRELKSRFVSARYDAAYQRWLSTGDLAGTRPCEDLMSVSTCPLRVYHATHRYFAAIEPRTRTVNISEVT